MKKLFIMISVFMVMLLSSIQASAMSGEGTDVSPYLIENTDDFLMIGYFPSHHFKLMSDISVDTTLEGFNGVLDGNSFKITTTKGHVFSNNSGNIMNLSISGGKIAITNDASGKIENSSISNAELVTTNNGIVSDCKSNYTGAIVKYNNGIIRTCVSTLGCIVTNNNSEGIISNCADCLHIANTNYGLIEACSTVEDILVDENSGIITNSFSVNSYFVSSNNGTIKKCYTTGDESLVANTAFVVSNSGTIDLCYSNLNISRISTNSPVGGISATNRGTVSRSYYCGTITSSLSVRANAGTHNYYVGGIAGYNSGEIEKSYTQGSVHATFTASNKTNTKTMYAYLYVGGITSHGGSVVDCYSNMYIHATSIEGSNYVNMTEDAYGIAGNSTIKNSYYNGNDILIDGTYRRATSLSIGTVYDDVKFSRVKRCCGGGIIENSYYLSDTPFEDDSTYGTPLSSSAMKMQVFYTDWDFDTVWTIDSEINDGYPYLQWQPLEEPEEFIINVESISIDKEEVILKVNETMSLTAIISPSNATNKNATWSSSNTNVVTVDNGVIRAVGEGTATVVIKTEDGGHIALCSVEVSGIMIKDTEMNINNFSKVDDSVSFDINLFSPIDVTGTVIVALYNKNNAIVTIKTYTPSSEINVSLDSAESNYIKVMWWNTNTLVPLTDYVQIDL